MGMQAGILYVGVDVQIVVTEHLDQLVRKLYLLVWTNLLKVLKFFKHDAIIQ